MESFIFLSRIDDLGANIYPKSFPLYNGSSIDCCKTETNCTKINIPTCRVTYRSIQDRDNTKLSENKKLGFKLSQKRLKQNIPVKELARQTGISNTTISRYEQGKFDINKIDIDILQKIANVLNIDIYDLLTDYLIFKLHHIQVLNDYLKSYGVTKKALAKQLNVSDTLVYSWFNKKERCPSYQLWQTTLKDYFLIWFRQNINKFKDIL